jgi:transcriptional regulator with XRE-family HTH domain
MTSTSVSPVVQRRVLAGELKNLRRSAGLTHVDVANRLGWQQGKVSKIESAKQRVGVDAVIALAEVCHATPEQRDRLVGLARTARRKGWWESYGDVLPPTERLYVGMEAEADRVRIFGVETIPDLLQTADYARAVLLSAGSRQDNPTDERGLERRLEVLLERQRAALEHRAIEVDSVLSESALRRVVGGKPVLGSQLRHLARLASQARARVRVLPFAAGAIPADASFTILGFHGSPHPEMAFVPSRSGYVCFEQEPEVNSHSEALCMLESLSMGPEESIGFLRDLERELVS